MVQGAGENSHVNNGCLCLANGRQPFCSFFFVGGCLGNGWLPLCPSFCDQKEAKSPAVPMRRPQPWSASTASKRWRFFRRFLAAKSDNSPADCCLPVSRKKQGFSSNHWPLCGKQKARTGQVRAKNQAIKQPCFTSSFPRPDGRAGPRRPAYTGCPGHGRTCRSRGGSCRGLPPTADGRGRGGYSPRSRSHGRRAGSR